MRDSNWYKAIQWPSYEITDLNPGLPQLPPGAIMAWENFVKGKAEASPPLTPQSQAE